MKRLLILFATCFFSYFITFLVLAGMGMDIDSLDSQLLSPILVVVMMVLVGLVTRSSLKEITGYGNIGFVTQIKVLALYIIGVMTYNAVFLIVGFKINSGNLLQSTTHIVIILILAPILEEIVFRGLIFSDLKKHCGPKFAIVFSALLFIFFHNYSSAHHFLSVALLSFVLSITRHYLGNIFIVIAMHFLYNLSSYILLGLT